MKKLERIALLFAFVIAVSGSLWAQQPIPQPSSPSATDPSTISIGGEPLVTLKRPPAGNRDQPQFLEAVIAPGRSMNTLQIKAFVPGKGEVDLLTTPPLERAASILGQNDEFGNRTYLMGAAILLPYANRITGTPSADGKTIATEIAGKTVSLPANLRSNKPGSPVLTMHGLMLNKKFEDVKVRNGSKESSVSAKLHAGDFDGHWLSQTDVVVHTVLKDNAFEISVTAKNVGHEPAPYGIAFHPWLRILSGDRAQVRLHVPASQRVLVNDNVVPTGQVEEVKGTPYDFTAPEGTQLGSLSMDDFFFNLARDKDRSATVVITDPAANFGLRVIALSPEIQGFQVYAPANRSVIAVEPQFNFADPYSKVWGDRNTGMVMVKPGHSVTWRVRLELFTPGKSN